EDLRPAPSRRPPHVRGAGSASCLGGQRAILIRHPFDSGLALGSKDDQPPVVIELAVAMPATLRRTRTARAIDVNAVREYRPRPEELDAHLAIGLPDRPDSPRVDGQILRNGHRSSLQVSRLNRALESRDQCFVLPLSSVLEIEVAYPDACEE